MYNQTIIREYLLELYFNKYKNSFLVNLMVNIIPIPSFLTKPREVDCLHQKYLISPGGHFEDSLVLSTYHTKWERRGRYNKQQW